MTKLTDINYDLDKLMRFALKFKKEGIICQYT